MMHAVQTEADLDMLVMRLIQCDCPKAGDGRRRVLVFFFDVLHLKPLLSHVVVTPCVE